MAEEERLQQFLAGQSIETNLSRIDLQKDSELSIAAPVPFIVQPVDTSLLTDEQRQYESELQCFPEDYSLWQQLINSIKVISSTQVKKSTSTATSAFQDREWRDNYLRNIYQRMLTGSFKYMVWLWIEYLLFEVSLLGYQLPSATLLPNQRTGPVPSTPYSVETTLDKAFAYVLSISFSPNIWILYINYLKKRNYVNDKQFMCATYEAALNKVGLDVYSGPIWADYVNYIKLEKTEALFEEQVKMDALRKLYQRAVVIPHTNVESLWKDYDAFENNLNKTTAKKILGEKSALYMNARVAFKELKNKMEPILRNTNLLLLSSTQIEEQESYWLKLLDWEKTNGLKLDDQNLIFNRQEYMFRSALTLLSHSEKMWIYFSSLLKSHKKDHLAVLNEAKSILPLNLLIQFSLLEALESNSQIEEAKNNFDDFLNYQLTKIDEISTSIKDSTAKLNDIMTQTPENPDQVDGLSSSLETYSTRLKTLENENNLSFIQIIRFIRRTEGVVAARAYFGRARKTNHCSPLVYLASAELEYFIAKEPVICFKIFELGMKKFVPSLNMTTIELDALFLFYREYCSLLLFSMDDANAKALFERIVNTCPQEWFQSDSFKRERILPILDLLIDYEKKFGGSSLSTLIEKKYLYLNQNDPVSTIIDMTSYYDLSCHVSTAAAVTKPTESGTSNPILASLAAKRKYSMSDPEYQPSIPQKKPYSHLFNPLPSGDHQSAISAAIHWHPIIEEVVGTLDAIPSYDGPAINVTLLMQSLTSVYIPNVLTIPGSPTSTKTKI